MDKTASSEEVSSVECEYMSYGFARIVSSIYYLNTRRPTYKENQIEENSGILPK